jgi:hypothetical protein
LWNTFLPEFKATFYRWKKDSERPEPDPARELRQLWDENSCLKKIVADLSLDKAMLQDVVVVELAFSRPDKPTDIMPKFRQGLGLQIRRPSKLTLSGVWC